MKENKPRNQNQNKMLIYNETIFYSNTTLNLFYVLITY